MDDPIIDLQVVESIRSVGVGDDRFAEELYKVFAEQAGLVIQELQAGVQRNDLVAVKRAAHRLKGSAANVGATALAKMAAVIETAIIQNTEGFPLAAVTGQLSALYSETRTKLANLALIA